MPGCLGLDGEVSSAWPKRRAPRNVSHETNWLAKMGPCNHGP
jgi:hypothetical protein